MTKGLIQITDIVMKDKSISALSSVIIPVEKLPDVIARYESYLIKPFRSGLNERDGEGDHNIKKSSFRTG